MYISAPKQKIASGRAAGRRRRARLGVLLLVGAAALMIALQLGREPAMQARLDYVARESPVPAGAGAERGLDAPSANLGPGLPPGFGSAADALAGDGLSRHRLAMLPTVHETHTQTAIESVEAAYGVILRMFRLMPNLDAVEVIEAEIEAAGVDFSRQVALLGLEPPLGENERDLVIASHFGADYVVRVRNEPPTGTGSAERWRIVVGYRGPTVGGDIGMEADPAVETGRTAESMGTVIGRYVYARLFPEEGKAVYEAVIMDASESDRERLEALRALSSMPGVDLSELSDAALRASLELARGSASVETRREIWMLLAPTRDPRLEQPLTDALLYDPAPDVRAEAAGMLLGYLPDPFTRAALEGASLNDPSGKVRLRARWSFMTESERDDYVTAALLDRSLPPEDRMAPLLLARATSDRLPSRNDFDGRLTLDDEQLAAVVEIARDGGSAAARRAALAELGRSRRRTVVEPLIDVSRNDSDPGMRLAAVSALGTYEDFFSAGAVVGPLLESLRGDPDASVRRAAVSALRRYAGRYNLTGALEAARETDPDSGVRAAIDDLLAPEEAPRAPIETPRPR